MTPVEIAVILVAAVFASIVKTMLGSGYPLILVPVVALFSTVETAAVIAAPANVLLNLILAVELWDRRHDTVFLGRFVVASIVGAAAGTLLLPVAPDRVLRLALAAVIVLFIVNRTRQVDVAFSPATTARLSPLVGGIAGLFQGATGVSGPIVAPWHLTLGLDRDPFVYSVGVIYGVSTAAQLAFIVGQGLFDAERILIALALIPIAFVFAPVGSRLRARLDLALFERLVIVLLVASALSLILRSF